MKDGLEARRAMIVQQLESIQDELTLVLLLDLLQAMVAMDLRDLEVLAAGLVPTSHELLGIDNEKHDWWDELTPAEQEQLNRSIASANRGELVDHEEVMRSLEETM